MGWLLALSHPMWMHAEGGGTLEQLNLGTHIFGTPVDKKMLMGKVVVMELWGMG